jgi:hypothetical protein
MNINELLGKTLVRCVGKKGDEEIEFETTEGTTYKLWHSQDCCESVTVEDICGDLSDLVGSPIIQAEENTDDKDPAGVKLEYPRESFTWTFYRLATAKGQVVIRWLGESNGYYSESVEFDSFPLNKL